MMQVKREKRKPSNTPNRVTMNTRGPGIRASQPVWGVGGCMCIVGWGGRCDRMKMEKNGTEYHMIVYMEQQSLDHPSVVDEACMVLAETCPALTWFPARHPGHHHPAFWSLAVWKARWEAGIASYPGFQWRSLGTGLRLVLRSRRPYNIQTFIIMWFICVWRVTFTGWLESVDGTYRQSFVVHI